MLFIAYTIHVFTGGESSQFYMPYFEADIHMSRDSILILACQLILAYPCRVNMQINDVLFWC